MLTDRETTIQIDPRHPCLVGHFPGNPIVPGALLLLRLKAVASAFCTAGQLASVDSAKFFSPVLAGQSLQVHCSRERTATACRVKLRLKVMRGQEMVCEARVSMRAEDAGSQ